MTSSQSDLADRLRKRQEEERQQIEELTLQQLRRLGVSLSNAAASAQRSIEADMEAATETVRALLIRVWLVPAAAGLSLFLVICGGGWGAALVVGSHRGPGGEPGHPRPGHRAGPRDADPPRGDNVAGGASGDRGGAVRGASARLAHPSALESGRAGCCGASTSAWTLHPESDNSPRQAALVPRLADRNAAYVCATLRRSTSRMKLTRTCGASFRLLLHLTVRARSGCEYRTSPVFRIRDMHPPKLRNRWSSLRLSSLPISPPYCGINRDNEQAQGLCSVDDFALLAPLCGPSPLYAEQPVFMFVEVDELDGTFPAQHTLPSRIQRPPEERQVQGGGLWS